MSPLCLFFPVLFAVLADGDAAPQKAPPTQTPAGDSVVRMYDLVPVTPVYDSGDEVEQTLLMPPSTGLWDEPHADPADLHESASSEVVVDLLGQIFGDELRYEGREIDLVGGSRLLVLAPPEVQTRVAGALAMLEEMLSSEVEVTVDVLKLPADADLPAGGVVDEAAAEQLLTQLPGRGAGHESYTVRLSAGRTSLVDQMRMVPFVQDYDVEIAQGATIYDPVVGHAADGLRLQLRGVPSKDGIVLSVVLLENTLSGDPEDVPIGGRGSIWNDSGEYHVGEDLAIQQVHANARSIAFDTFLPNGKAVLVTSESLVGKAPSREILVLRRARGNLTAYASRQVPGTTRRVIAVDTEMLSLPRTSIDGPAATTDETAARDPRITAKVSTEPSLFLFDWMKRRFSVWRRMGPWALVVTDPSWDDTAADDLQRLMAGWDASPQVISVEARLHDASGVPVRWQLPLLAGSSCGVRLGSTRECLIDWDVEVAQNAAMNDPHVETLFQGLVAAISSARGGAGGLTLGVRAVGRLGNADRALEPSGKDVGRIDVPAPQRLDVDERLSVVAAPDQAVHFQLGDVGQGSSDLRLELVVR